MPGTPHSTRPLTWMFFMAIATANFARRLVSALLCAVADHPLMPLTLCPVHPPRALVSPGSTPPSTGPGLPLHSRMADLCHQPVRKHCPLPVLSTFTGVPKGQWLSPSHVALSMFSLKECLPHRFGVNTDGRSTYLMKATTRWKDQRLK